MFEMAWQHASKFIYKTCHYAFYNINIINNINLVSSSQADLFMIDVM